MKLKLFLVMILLVMASGFLPASATQDIPQYQLIWSPLVWLRVDELPFTVIRPMCRDEVVGWCDPEMQNLESSYLLISLIDYETGVHGVVKQIVDTESCWLWWFQPEYGLDGNPHPSEYYWVECPVFDMEQFENYSNRR